MKKITLYIITIFSLMLTSAYAQEVNYSVNTQIVCAGGEALSGTNYSVPATAVGEAIGENSLGATYDILGGFIPTITDFSIEPLSLIDVIAPEDTIQKPPDTEGTQVIPPKKPNIQMPTFPTVAPQRPTLDPITSPTNISSQDLSGGKAKGTSVWLNDVKIAPADKNTAWGPETLTLQEGDNPVVVYSKDKYGNRSISTIEENIIYDTTAPVINDITFSDLSSEDSSYTNQSMITISGGINDITDVDVVITVINETYGEVDRVELSLLSEYYLSQEDYTFSDEISLVEGRNTVTITATDELNYTSSEQRTIYLDTIDPATPTINYITPVYEITQELTGDKEIDTSIWINGIKEVDNNSDTTWLHTVELTEGNNLFSIAVKDKAANESSSNNITILLDTSPPIDFMVTDDGDYAITREEEPQDTLHAQWTASDDPETGISEYQYAIGTAGGSTDTTQGWISLGLDTEISYQYAYQHRQAYYFSIKAINNAGGVTTSYSDGIIVNRFRPELYEIHPWDYSVYTAERDEVGIYCTAYADADGDPLEFRFLINDTVVKDWSAENYHLWIPQTEEEGFNTITAEIRDDLSGEDSLSVQVYIAVVPPEPQKYRKFNNSNNR